VTVRSKAWVGCRSHADIACSNPAVGIDVCSFVGVVCYQVQVSGTDRSIFPRSPSECGVSEYNPETSTVRRLRPTRAVEP
jgi:hypothetical protein